MKVLIQTLGSAGDTYPFIGIGKKLVERGHDVVLFANGVFEEEVERAGLAFSEMGDSDSYMSLAANPEVWDTRRGVEFIFRAVVEHLEESMTILGQHLDGTAVLVNSSLGFGARMLRDIHEIPLVTAHLAPSLFRSTVRLPRTEIMWVRDNFPSWMKRLWWRLGDLLVDRVVTPELNSVRARYGLAPVSRVLDEWAIYSPDHTLGLFPDWFGPPQPDWKRPVSLTGFALYDRGDEEALSSNLQAWLEDGPPPVVFTGGSANYQAGAFLERAANVCAQLGIRGVLITPNDDDRPDITSSAIRYESYVPFSAILARTSALVSHGGVGTCAQALAAGVPHLVAHLNFDQKDNASRLEDLGAGIGMRMANFIDGAAAAELSTLLQGGYGAKARELSVLVDRDRALDMACQKIELAANVG